MRSVSDVKICFSHRSSSFQVAGLFLPVMSAQSQGCTFSAHQRD